MRPEKEMGREEERRVEKEKNGVQERGDKV